MSEWTDAFSGFGLGVLGTVTDAVEAVGSVATGVGSEFTNSSAANANLVEITRLRAISDMQRKAEQTKILSTVVYGLLALGATAVVTMLVLRVLKK